MRAVIVASALSLALATACNTARDQQQKSDEAQATADQKIAEATQQASEKINEAQAQADKQTAAAQAAFTKMREDYRHEVNIKLAELDKKMAEREANAKTASAAKRAQLEASLVDIRAGRDAFTTEYRSLETASATTWDDVKQRIDKSLSNLEAKFSRV